MPPDPFRPRRVKLAETASLYHVRRGSARSKPALRLGGRWLHQAGFRAGERVTVTVLLGRLIIERDG